MEKKCKCDRCGVCCDSVESFEVVRDHVKVIVDGELWTRYHYVPITTEFYLCPECIEAIKTFFFKGETK